MKTTVRQEQDSSSTVSTLGGFRLYETQALSFNLPACETGLMEAFLAWENSRRLLSGAEHSVRQDQMPRKG